MVGLDEWGDPVDPHEISCAQYLELCSDMDGGKLEYYADRMRIGGEPFYEFVKSYLALRGEEPRPKDPSPSE